MNRPTFFVLVALNAFLAAVLAVEWYVTTEKSVPTVVREKTEGEEAITEELPNLNLTETSEDSYSDLVDRPLFIKGRKPVNEPVPESVPVAAVKKVEAFNWDLTGIFSTPKGVTAFFSRANSKVPKDNNRKHKVGEELDGWKVGAINPDGVILTQLGENKTLLLRKPKPKVPTPMTANANNRVAPPNRVAAPIPQGTQPPQNQQPEIVQPAVSEAGSLSVTPESESSSVEEIGTENP